MPFKGQKACVAKQDFIQVSLPQGANVRFAGAP